VASDKTKGIAALLASAFGFAAMAVCVRLADDVGPPLPSVQKAFFRNSLAFFISFAVLCRVRRGTPLVFPRTAGTWTLLVARSVFGTLGIWANFYALGIVPVAEAQTLNKTAPFFTVLFAALFLRERAGWRQAVALLTAFGGVLFVVKPGFAVPHATGFAAALAGGLFAGAAYVCVRALRRDGVSSAFVVVFFSFFSCCASMPFLAIRFDPMTCAQWAVLVAAGAFAALGQFGLTLAYGFAAPRDIAVYDYASVFFAAVFGFFFFGTVPDLWSVAGVFLIVLAALILRPR
jgi:drug/metabolite transporter (DMT)-like permease